MSILHASCTAAGLVSVTSMASTSAMAAVPHVLDLAREDAEIHARTTTTKHRDRWKKLDGNISRPAVA
jgi:hypothetical protein